MSKSKISLGWSFNEWTIIFEKKKFSCFFLIYKTKWKNNLNIFFYFSKQKYFLGGGEQSGPYGGAHGLGGERSAYPYGLQPPIRPLLHTTKYNAASETVPSPRSETVPNPESAKSSDTSVLDPRYWTCYYRPLQTPSYLDIGSKHIILIQTFVNDFILHITFICYMCT